MFTFEQKRQKKNQNTCSQKKEPKKEKLCGLTELLCAGNRDELDFFLEQRQSQSAVSPRRHCQPTKQG